MRPYPLALVAALAVTLAACSNSSDPVSSDAGGPGVIAMQPAPGTSYVAADQVFSVEFSEAMATSSVEAAYRLATDDGAIGGQYFWNDQSTTMSFVPNESLVPGQDVDIQWGPGMRSQRGQALVTQDGEEQTGFAFRCQVYAAPVDYDSNGQRIFLTGSSASGEIISFTMGDGFVSPMPGYAGATGGWSETMRFGGMGRGMMGGGMMGSTVGGYGMSCATCHGPDGTGGRYLAMGTVETPNITYRQLTEADDDEGHEHAPYSDEAILRAITEGTGSDGEPLDAFMPRWQMTPADQQDLLEFLRSL